MAKKQVKYEGNNYQESDFDPMDIYFNKYDRIAEETYDVTSKKNAEIKEHIHSEAKKIYKYYLKQGARYGVSAAAVVAGVVGLASGVLPVMVLGGALTAAGVGGVGVTRFGRAKRNELTYNRALDGKRLRYLWSEARRIRKIDRYIETLKDVRKNHPERVDKARSLEKRIKNERYFYTLENYDNNNDIIYDSSLDKYLVNEDFALPELSLNDIEYLKSSKLISPEMRKKYGFFQYEYDDSQELSKSESDCILTVLKGKNDDVTVTEISTEDISEYYYVRLYPRGKQFFHNIGIIIESNGKRYFSEGYLDESGNCVDCYEILA